MYVSKRLSAMRQEPDSPHQGDTRPASDAPGTVPETGHPTPSVRKIARFAGVSASTVSRVLRDVPGVSASARHRVHEAVAALGLTLEDARLGVRDKLRSIAGGVEAEANRLIGLIIPDVSTAFYVEVLKGVEAEAYQRGYALILHTTAGGPPDEALARVLRSSACRGFVLMSPRGELPRPLAARVASANAHAPLPLVVVDRHKEGSPFPHIEVDNLKGALDATRFLIERGHRRIALITGPLAIPSALDRLRGYRLALEEAGIGYDPALVTEGTFLKESGYQTVREWLQQDKPLPDAWFCSNDLMAFGALQALREAGLSVPGDVAIVGFDDVPEAASCAPPLTTVAQPMAEMGALAVRLVTSMIEGGEPGVPRVVLETHLVVRQSA